MGQGWDGTGCGMGRVCGAPQGRVWRGIEGIQGVERAHARPRGLRWLEMFKMNKL